MILFPLMRRAIYTNIDYYPERRVSEDEDDERMLVDFHEGAPFGRRVLRNSHANRKWVGKKLGDALRMYPNLIAKGKGKIVVATSHVEGHTAETLVQS
ncbi:hypothetical protein CDL15_Pgr016298 [Punica granatum]|uniref:Uncharacterized protein n=1 Tax=Punica granatum TaxID=22663 RepID=A0A218W6H0_PUNGR|nr:hypothetical protein CDL15_Pgr016298 [Punica granatum]